MTLLLLLLTAAAPSLAFTDPPIGEHEPNQTRDTATPATLTNGGAFTGITRGFVFDDPLSTADTTRDVWRVTLTANPALIQRHTLQLSTAGTQGHTGSIMGVSATAGVIDPASFAALQNTSINTVPARFCQVYTLGQAAPFFIYRITGSSGTTSPYTVTLNTQTVTPTPIRPCPFFTGQITITTVGRTTLNTKMFLYNADTLAPVPDGVNDDAAPSADLPTGSSQSMLTRTLATGRYLLAIANSDTVDNRLPPADDRYASVGFANLTESSGLLVSSSSTATGDFSFCIYDSTMYAPGSAGGSPVPVPLNISAAKPGPYGIAFFSFAVVPHCGAADIGSAGGRVCWDGALDNNDFIVFIDQFFRKLPSADVGIAGGLPGTDHVWDNNDWIAYLNLFFTGC